MRSQLIGVFFIAVYAFAQVGDVAVYRGGNTTADKVAFTPAGNIAATTVKTAIEELDGEKQPLDAALIALAAGSDFVRFAGPTTPTKVFTLPDATATLLYNGGALGTPASGSLANTTGLPAAGVVNTPAGNIAAVTAQAAIDELDDEKLVAIPSVNAQVGTTYSLQASDNGKVITMANGSDITLTVPAGLGAGFNVLIVQLGAGAVTPTASGTTINQRLSYTKTAGQYAVATLVSYAADTFVLSGDLQ